MNTRRQARECAIQVLFQLVFCPQDINEALATFWKENEEIDATARRFTEELVQGVSAHLEELDAHIQKFADNWALSRIARLDLCVLRLGLYELLHRPDIPPVVSINEAVDLAKYFSSNESGRFVNGILDRARRDLLTGERVK